MSGHSGRPASDEDQPFRRAARLGGQSSSPAGVERIGGLGGPPQHIFDGLSRPGGLGTRGPARPVFVATQKILRRAGTGEK